LAKTPGFTAVVILVLALGIGTNVALFHTMYAALVKPLPFAEPDRLVMGRATSGGQINPWASGPDYQDYRDRSDVFDGLAAILPFATDYTITGGDHPERVAGTAAAVNLFRTLGVGPQLGRHFNPNEALAGGPDVMIISHGYWQRRFAGDVNATGQTLVVDGSPYTVIGIMPAGFHIVPEVDLWRPMRPDRDAVSMRDRHNWLLVGRLKPGITLRQAQSHVDAISTQLQTDYPETNERKGLLLTGLQDVLVEDYRSSFAVLLAAVGLVLLIACGNVTGMLLARAPARRVELSVRAALGASRSRLVSQMLVESILLAAAGGILGTALAVWLQQLILELIGMTSPGIGEMAISTPMLASAVMLTLGAGLLAGIYPALSTARFNLAQDLKAGARTTDAGGARFRGGLVVAQVAVSIVLLISSGLLIQSFARVRAVDPGFEAEHLFTAEIDLPRSRYSQRDRLIQFHIDLLERVRGFPGVVSAGVINHLPIREPRNVFRVYPADDPDRTRSVFLRSVLPGYFDTMRIPQLMGRGINDADGANNPNVSVISETTARTFFPDQDPLGRQLTLDYFGRPVTAEVVGVVGDVRISGLHSDSDLALYLSYRQLAYNTMKLAVRTNVDPELVGDAVRAAVWSLDDEIPVDNVATMEDLIANSVSGRKTIALSLTVYAVLPLVMAAVGLYAVLAYYVTQRYREIGVRMALGADARVVGKLIMGRGIGLITAGVALGVAGALGLTRLFRQALFGVEPTDVPTFAGACLFVVSIAIIACLVPAWRAARVDPAVALRAE
jgi:putative ABC transport system permease protein